MEQEIQNFTIERIREEVPHMIGIGNDVLVDYRQYEIAEKLVPSIKHPIRLDGLLIALCEKGEDASISINLKEFTVKSNDLVICSPGDLLQPTISKGIRLSQTLMVSSHFLKDMYISLNSFIPFFAARKEHPVFHLKESEMQELKSIFLLIYDTIKGEDYFRIDQTKRLLGAYLYKLGSILYRHRPELQAEASQPLRREEILFKRFIQLVSENHRKERRVDYYADQLFLSPKHFSTVIKKVSGKSAGQWIDEYVILEAKTLLKYSAMSIQEIAYYMNFPNPSFFGKYFKHHTGMSPSEYKSQM